MVDLKSEDILTCLCLIVVGYFLAKMFSKRCDGFRIGGQTESNIYENLKDGTTIKHRIVGNI
jgi:hypothetical protein